MPQKTEISELTTSITITTTYPPGYPDQPSQTDWVEWGRWLHEVVRNPSVVSSNDNQLFRKKTERFEIKLLAGRLIKQKTMLNLKPVTMHTTRTLPSGIQPYSIEWYNYMAKEISTVSSRAEEMQFNVAKQYRDSDVFNQISNNRLFRSTLFKAITNIFVNPFDAALALSIIKKESNFGSIFSKTRRESIKRHISDFEKKLKL